MFAGVPDHRAVRDGGLCRQRCLVSDPGRDTARTGRVARGPYHYDGERALLEQYRIDVLVTKNSGGAMTRPKLDAAVALGVAVVMIDRPALPAGVASVATVDEAAAWVERQVMSRKSPKSVT